VCDVEFVSRETVRQTAIAISLALPARFDKRNLCVYMLVSAIVTGDDGLNISKAWPLIKQQIALRARLHTEKGTSAIKRFSFAVSH